MTTHDVEYSIIIPTMDRQEDLRISLDSLRTLDFPKDQFEILVVDNNSRDETRSITETFLRANPDLQGRYFLEPEPGLHAGRHRGAMEARGDILCYLDDDVRVTPGWLRAVAETFMTTDAALVGGKVLPEYEVTPPDWVSQFLLKVADYGYCIGQLSLMDLGEQIRQIDPVHVWGCNFSIRKETLYRCGGFHPDCLPWEMIHRAGDGETGLSYAVRQKGLKAYYHPKAMIYHRIPKERLTVEYFCKRMFHQGISDSYTHIRKTGSPAQTVKEIVMEAYAKGKIWHREKVLADTSLLEWTVRDHYFLKGDKSIPSGPDYTRQSYYEKTRNIRMIVETFRSISVPIEERRINPQEFVRWMKECGGIVDRYQKSGDVFIEKCLEHYLADSLMQLHPGDVYIDVACSDSNFADVLQARGIAAYKLDLSFPAGIRGNRIGADAGQTPLQDNSIHGMSLQCAYECFQGDADIRFIREAQRLLKKHGKLAIIPLYIENEYINVTSEACDQSKVTIDPGALRVWRDDRYKVPFARHYSAEAFRDRILSQVDPRNSYTLLYYTNLEELRSLFPNQRIYCDLVFYMERKAETPMKIAQTGFFRQHSPAVISVDAGREDTAACKGHYY